MDREAFLDRFPEFETASESQIQAVLDEAARAVDSGVFGDRYDEAHGLLAAHLLWTTPFGVSLRMDSDQVSPTKSRYFEEYRKIRREVTPRSVVT